MKYTGSIQEYLIGKTFYNWKILEFIEKKKSGPYFKAQCKCGIIKIINGRDVKRGKTRSCGNCNTIDIKEGQIFDDLTVMILLLYYC